MQAQSADDACKPHAAIDTEHQLCLRSPCVRLLPHPIPPLPPREKDFRVHIDSFNKRFTELPTVLWARLCPAN